MASGGLLLSSPGRMAQNSNNPILLISSSPEFPSITDLLAKSPKKAPLRSGSNAAPIPETAVRTFTSAASIWRAVQLDGEHRFEAERMPQPQITINADPGAHSVIELSPETTPAKVQTEEKKPRKRAAAPAKRRKKAENPEVDDIAVKPTVAISEPPVVLPTEKPPRKSRAKAVKDTTDGQSKLPKGRVTKPRAAPKEKAPKKKTEVVSRHFSAEVPAPQPVAAPIADEPVSLEPAMRRRLDWTPPPEDLPPFPKKDSSTVDETPSSSMDLEQTKSIQNGVFQNLLGTYGCRADGGPLSEASASQASNDILGKRKLIELVATTMDKSKTPEVSPVKSRAPKKKARTITDLATAAYRVIPDDSEGSTSATKSKDGLLECFEVESDQAGSGKKEVTGKAKAPKKPAKARVSKKKAESRKQLLLSPQSALRQVSGQDFVFGTASQLATEEDPDLLRALHEAMKASNEPDSDSFGMSSPLVSDLAVRRKAGNRLWGAGARGDDGDLFDLEVFDLTESPAPPQAYSLPRNPPAIEKNVQPSPTRVNPIEIQSSEYDALDLTDSPLPTSHLFSTQTKPKQTIGQMRGIIAQKPPETPHPEVTVDLDLEPPPSNQEHYQLIEQSQANSSPKAPAIVEGPPRPKYELFTDAQLAKEIASYGFKAIKRRTAMISLLEECWEIKNRTSAPIPPAASMPSPTRPKGRPRKGSVVTSAAPTHVPPPAASPTRARGRARKDSAATTVVQPDTAVSSQANKRPRGRPKKDATPSPAKPKAASAVVKGKSRAVAATPTISKLPAPAPPIALTPRRKKATAILEIADSDSEDPFASSPMSPPGNDQFSSPIHRVEDISINEDTEMSLLATSPTDQQASMFRYISKAVTTAPRTTDPAQPSWHEKMLMYDPIILEDLAAWLNSGQLDRVGYDGEVAPGDVKRWCESKSICCLWRVNLNGKARKRF